MNQDTVMRKSFEHAYRETRWNLGEWGWYYYCNTEEKQLAMLVRSRLQAVR